MRRIQTILLSLAMLPCMAIGSQAQSPGCRASDASTTRILTYVKTWATLDVPSRDSVGLTGVDTATVVSETDSTNCAKVVQAIDSAFDTTGTVPASQVIVRAGGTFFTWAPSTDPNEPSRLIHVVDSALVYRKSIVAF